MVTLIRFVQIKVLENPPSLKETLWYVIRDTDGAGSGDTGAANRGKHNNQCLEIAQARSG